MATDTLAERALADTVVSRRLFLRYTPTVVALIASGVLPGQAGALINGLPNDDAFRLAPMSEVLQHLGGTPVQHDEVSITIPDLVENGSNVRVNVASTLAEVAAIYVLVEANPFPFAAAFSIPAGTDASVGVNLKLAQSSLVAAVVRAADGLFWASKYAQVTIGGCS